MGMRGKTNASETSGSAMDQTWDPRAVDRWLYALHGLMIELRSSAYRGQSSADTAEVLDVAEHLVRLSRPSARVQDIEEFRAQLEALVAEHPKLGYAMTRFEQDPTPDRW